MASTRPKMKAKSHGHSTTLHPWTRNKHRLRAWINAAHRVSGSSTAEESGRISRRHLRINTRTNKRGTTKYQDCCDTIINSQVLRRRQCRAIIIMTGMPSTHRTSSRNMTKAAYLIGSMAATLPKQPVQRHSIYGCDIANTACPEA